VAFDQFKLKSGVEVENGGDLDNLGKDLSEFYGVEKDELILQYNIIDQSLYLYKYINKVSRSIILL
jgi:hypothetical protein